MKKLIAVLTALGILTTGIYMPNNYNSALVSITASAITMDGKYIYDSETGIKMTVYGEICDSWDVDYGYHIDYIRIPSNLLSVPVRVIGNGAFANRTGIKDITIPDSVESIGDHAFKGCSDLTRITIPDSVTSIGGGAFDGTPWLENMQEQNPLVIVNNILIDGKKCGQDVIVPDTVTSISAYAFKECSELTSITIPDSVTSIGGGAFNRCESLASIKGYRDSEAERYAKEFGFDFVALEKDSVSISYSNGDVTGDGIIDATDASFILTAYAKSSTNEDDGMNEEQRTFADVNNDDVVDAVDASTVLTYYARSSVDFKGTFEEYLDEFVFKKEINPDDYFKAEIKTHEISKDTYGNENLTIVFEFTNVTDETFYVNDNEIAPNGTWEKRIFDKTDRWGSMIKHGGYIHYVFSDSEMNKMFSGGLFFKLDENLDVVEYRGFLD